MILAFFSALIYWQSFLYAFLFAFPSLMLIVPSSLIVLARDEKRKKDEIKKQADKMKKEYGNIQIDVKKIK